MIFHPQNSVLTGGAFAISKKVNALAGACLNKEISKEFFANFINRPCIVESGVREFNGQISGRTLVKVHFIDELIAQLSAKPGNDFKK